MSPDVRPARFAGSWYPGQRAALERELDRALDADQAEHTPRPARLLLLPHAGYRYSLRIAAPAVARHEVPEVAVVLCPNHRVPPPVISIWPRGAWETPLGAIPIEEELAAAIQRECPDVVDEPLAHAEEHGVELLLPLLQRQNPALRVVPLVVAAPRYPALEALGQGLARAIAAYEAAHGTRVLLVASSDMSHFLSAAEAEVRDQRALAPLLALDPPTLLSRCESERISMCGVRPATAALVAAKRLGAEEAELIRYGHSGEVSGDDERVVAYASVAVR